MYSNYCIRRKLCHCSFHLSLSSLPPSCVRVMVCILWGDIDVVFLCSLCGKYQVMLYVLYVHVLHGMCRCFMCQNYYTYVSCVLITCVGASCATPNYCASCVLITCTGAILMNFVMYVPIFMGCVSRGHEHASCGHARVPYMLRESQIREIALACFAYEASYVLTLCMLPNRTEWGYKCNY